jgi:hypothetical protein
MQIQTFADTHRVVISGFDPVLFKKLKVPDCYTVVIDPPVPDPSVFDGLGRTFQNVAHTVYVKTQLGDGTFASSPQTIWTQTLLPIT